MSRLLGETYGNSKWRDKMKNRLVGVHCWKCGHTDTGAILNEDTNEFHCVVCMSTDIAKKVVEK